MERIDKQQSVETLRKRINVVDHTGEEVDFALSRFSPTRRLLHNWRILVKGHSWLWMQRGIGSRGNYSTNNRHHDNNSGMWKLGRWTVDWILKQGWWKIEGVLGCGKNFFENGRGEFWNVKMFKRISRYRREIFWKIELIMI